MRLDGLREKQTVQIPLELFRKTSSKKCVEILMRCFDLYAHVEHVEDFTVDRESLRSAISSSTVGGTSAWGLVGEERERDA